MQIIPACTDDLAEILRIQHLAFRREAEEYNDFDIDPMTQTVEMLEEEFKTSLFLKAVDEQGAIIGSIRGCVNGGTSYIGRTSVHPEHQGKGIGTALIRALENINKAPRYEINSSIRCPQNIRLYERLGYVRFKEITTENNGFVYLEKLSADAEDIFRYEAAMWEAAKNNDPKQFLTLVDEDAVMICGGYRCLGAEYSQIIKDFDLAGYTISDFETITQTQDICQVHYIISTSVSLEENRDLEGRFHVTSTWKKHENGWKLIFNMDSRIFG